jgi:hypothetical protein
MEVQKVGMWTRISGAEISTSSIDWAELNRLLPEDGDRIQSPKRCILNKKNGR